ncbi:unnamed protein product, partial [Laminaria digitata]
SFIPSSGAGGVSEQDAVRQALEELAGFSDRNSPVNYPARGEPLREDTTPWLASICFPVLFPLGVGDPFNDLRRRRVKFSEAITHLMKLVDRPPPIDGVPQVPHYRFASHRTFRYWCLDTKMRRTAKEQCRFFLVQNQEQVQVPVDEITEEELRQIMGRAVRYVSNVSGTDGYWLAQQGHLEDAVDQLPSLTAFTTYSAADHHWYDLHRLFPRATEEPPPGDDAAVRDIRERNRGLIDNPHIADWWTWERMKTYKEVFFAPDTADATWHWDRAEWQSRGTLHVHGCSPWGCEPDERLTELSRRYLKGFIGRRSRTRGGAADADGGVPDAEYEDVQERIFLFLRDVGFTARNPTPQAKGVPVSEEARAEGLRELARDMRGFDWSNQRAILDRYANLLNACERHTRC